MYSKILPDYSDLDNDSGVRPGYKVFIIENDGGVSIQFQNADDISDSDTLRAVFMNKEEAKDFLDGFKKALDRAAYKNANHRSRAKDI